MTEVRPASSDAQVTTCAHAVFVNGHCRDCGRPAPWKVATLANPNPRVTCPVCDGEVGTRRDGRMRSHVRKIADVGTDGEPEYALCGGSGWPA